MPSKTSYLFLLPQTPRTLHTYNRHKPTRHLVHWDTLTLTIQSPDQSIQAHNPILCAPTPHRNSIIIEENISTTDETTITSHSTRHEKIKQKQTTHAQQVIFAEDIVKVTLADMEKQNKYRGHPYCFQIHTATGETVMFSAESASELTSWIATIPPMPDCRVSLSSIKSIASARSLPMDMPIPSSYTTFLSLEWLPPFIRVQSPHLDPSLVSLLTGQNGKLGISATTNSTHRTDERGTMILCELEQASVMDILSMEGWEYFAQGICAKESANSGEGFKAVNVKKQKGLCVSMTIWKKSIESEES